MARALLSELVTYTTGPIVPTGTVVAIMEEDGVTPIAQSLYAAASGGSALVGTSRLTDAYGRIFAYADIPQRCTIKPAGALVATPAEFRPDWSDVPTLTATQTFTASKFENLPDPLDDNWAFGTGAGYEYVALSRGTTATPPNTLGTPMLWLQEKIKQNQDPSRQVPATVFIQKELFGSPSQSLRTLTGATSTTFTDSGASWTPGAFAPTATESGHQIDIVSGTGAGQHREIASNGVTSGTVTTPWTVTPDATSTYVINQGGSAQTPALLVNLNQYSTSTPLNLQGQEAIGIMSYARRISGNGGVYGALFLAQNNNALGQAFGLELDAVNASGAEAPVWTNSLNRTVGLNIAGFNAAGGTKNSLAILIQASSPAAFKHGQHFGSNAISDYVANATAALTEGIALDFQALSEGTTTPKLIRIGSSHVALLGRVQANNADVDLVTWVADILNIQADTIKLNSAAGTNVLKLLSTNRAQADMSAATAVGSRLLWQTSVGTNTDFGVIPGAGGAIARINVYNNPTPASGEGLRLYATATDMLLDTFDAGGGTVLPLSVSFGGVVRFKIDVNGLGFFGVTPVARPTAYVQTYATATRTHANPTATALTAASGTADGTVDDVTAAHNQTILNNNFKEMATAINALVADVANVKQVLNSVIDDDQAVGLKQ